MAFWIRDEDKKRWRGFSWTWYVSSEGAKWFQPIRSRLPWKGAALMKGWWMLGTWGRNWRRWTTDAKVAVGGEDNMLQCELGLPVLGFVAVGVRVPRGVTKGWVHHRREFGIDLRGIWPTFYFAYDSQMADMEDYYRRNYLKQGKPLPDYLNRVSLWSGWKAGPNPYKVTGRLGDFLLGKREHTTDELRVYEGVKLALPEGVYEGTVTFKRERYTRPRRWRPYRDDIIGEWASEKWLPFPGKGENSWDCGDDGFKEHTSTIRRYVNQSSLAVDSEDAAKVVADTIRQVLRYRARHGGLTWEPEGMGVMR